MKKLLQGDVAWLTQNEVLVWELDTKRHQPVLIPNWEAKMCAALDVTPCGSHMIYLRRWQQPLGILRNITPVVAGAWGMFTRLQNASNKSRGRRVTLSSAVHDELSDWRLLVGDLASRPTHL